MLLVLVSGRAGEGRAACPALGGRAFPRNFDAITKPQTAVSCTGLVRFNPYRMALSGGRVELLAQMPADDPAFLGLPAAPF